MSYDEEPLSFCIPVSERAVTEAHNIIASLLAGLGYTVFTQIVREDGLYYIRGEARSEEVELSDDWEEPDV